MKLKQEINESLKRFKALDLIETIMCSLDYAPMETLIKMVKLLEKKKNKRNWKISERF